MHIWALFQVLEEDREVWGVLVSVVLVVLEVEESNQKNGSEEQFLLDDLRFS